MPINTFTASGSKATSSAKLPKSIFETEVSNHQLIKDAYLAYLANGRINLAKTLKRGQVSGGGKKPWQQKGTGRARAGSNRSPIWRGGGITFGPSGSENYNRKINSKAKLLALKQALTLAVNDKNCTIIEDFVIKDGKTKNAAALLARLNSSSRTLIVVSKKDKSTLLAINNLPEIIISTAAGLNVFDVLNAKNLIFTKDALLDIESRLGGAK